MSGLSTKSFESRDEQEVSGYSAVCKEIFQGYDAMALSENIIKQLHGLLLQFSSKDERHRGNYKKLSNNVDAFDETGKSLGIVFETATPLETPLKMQELISWTNSQLEQRTLHPLLVIGIFVVTFLAIHPFQDGNGRLSRILTTLLLLKTGYLSVQYSSLESIIERSKEAYYLALRKTQGNLKLETPELGPWLTFCLRALQKQKIHLASKITREQSLQLHTPETSSRIIILVQGHGRLGISDLETMTGINRNTLKKQLAGLVEDGALLRFGKGRATWYVAA